MKRHRERGKTEDFGNVVVHYTDQFGVQTDYVYGVENWIHHLETFDDVVDGKKSDFNPGYHVHFIQPGKPIDDVTIEVSPGAYVHYLFSNGGTQAVDILGVLRKHDFGIEDWIDDFGANAEDHFLTAVQDKNSLINFIIELIEVCEGNLKVAKTISRKIETALETFWRIFKKTGSYWVAWNFAWKPTINDIHSFFTTLQRAEKRVKWLREHNHRPVKVHYREGPRDFSGVISTDATWVHRVPGGTPHDIPIPPQLHSEISYECKISLSAWAWVRYDIEDVYLFSLDDAIGMCALIMQGVYNPAKIVWEAIPWSWLVEWFTNKRAELIKEKLSLAKLIFPDSTILGTGWTLHLQKCVGSSTLLVDNASGGTARYDIGSYFLDLYDRRPGLPTGSPAFRFDALSAWQTSILAAIGSNWGGHRRR
jgi:hypothetical protein